MALDLHGMRLPMISLPIEWPTEAIAAWGDRWLVSELSLFGSILRQDFRADSDIDCLVSFRPEADWSLLDHLQMQQELIEILRRDVDLVSKRAIDRSQNWLRRQEILSTAQVIYTGPVYA
jgi:predicted nucleotidyltransferase